MEVLLLDLAEGDKGEAAPPRVRLVVRGYPSDAKGFVSLTPECDTIEGLEQAVAELKKSMESLLRRAREKFQLHLVQAEGETAVANFHSTEEIWRTLEKSASIEEMRESFNSLGRQKRQEVADFVLTQLNIFKGTASTFSQHYNEAEHFLE
jgi:hypothetical protein